jgi:preprotein translocase subunit SecE
MSETNSNSDAVQPTATAEQLVSSDDEVSMIGSPLPLNWIVGGVVLLVILFIAKKTGWLDRVRVFFLQTREELLKCAWPGRDELRGSTWMVLVAVAMLGLFTFLADWLLGGLLIQDVLLNKIGGGGTR